MVVEAGVEWIQNSDLASLREGVIEKIEVEEGYAIKAGQTVGTLVRKTAELTVAKAKVAYEGKAAEEKAVAQRDLAVAVVATNVRLNARNKGIVSEEEMRKAEAEVKVAVAMHHEAIEKRALDEAELELAKQAYLEHEIKAPYDGVVLDRLKQPGESVRANDPVLRIGNLDKLRAFAYVPLDYAYRVREGQVVDLQPRLTGTNGQLAIEQKRFRGKITFVDPEIQANGETAVRVYAEFDNKQHELRPGLKASMTIYLDEPPAPAVSARTKP